MATPALNNEEAVRERYEIDIRAGEVKLGLGFGAGASRFDPLELDVEPVLDERATALTVGVHEQVEIDHVRGAGDRRHPEQTNQNASQRMSSVAGLRRL